MNLRQTLLWKILLGASCISIVYYSYILYGYYDRNQSSWKDYSNEKAEMEKNEFDNESPFFKMIEDLEKKLQDKSANVFTFANNPADLRRIIEIEGMELYYGVGTNDIDRSSVDSSKDRVCGFPTAACRSARVIFLPLFSEESTT